MLEGKLKIELTDVKTGKKKIHEQHNFVTDNVQFLLNAVDPKCIMPLYEKGMGGLLLFDNEITDAVENHLIGRPKNSKMIGYADGNIDISTSWKGSRNAAECVQTNDSYTTVWDFSTAQLNGTIGAIALAPLKETYSSGYSYSEDPETNNLFSSRGTRTVRYVTYQNQTYLGTTSYNVPSENCQPIYYDPATNFMYFIQYVYGTNHTIILIGRFRFTMNYGVNQEPYSTERPEILFTSMPNDDYPTIDIGYTCEDAQGISSTTHEMALNTLVSRCWYGDKQGYVYAIKVNEITASGTYTVTGSRIMWTKFKVYDGSFDCVEAKYADFDNKIFSPSPSSYTGSSTSKLGSFAALLDDDKFIVLNNGNQGCYILTKSVSGISITDQLSFTSNKTASITVMPMGIASMGGGLVYGDGRVGIKWVPEGATYTEPYKATFYPYNCPFAFNPTNSFASTASVSIPNILLSTVCNLSQAVQKTSAQTMKITYTITSYRPMYVSTQPHDTSGTSGTEKTLTVAVMDGAPAYTYQWKISSDNTNWSNCSGATATTADYTFTLSSSTGDKYYRCVVTDSLGNSVTSLSAYVTLTT